MDDVQSFGVIYINYNMVIEYEVEQVFSQMSDVQGVKYFQFILMYEFEINGLFCVSVVIYC